jgi:hypothetical protein
MLASLEVVITISIVRDWGESIGKLAEAVFTSVNLSRGLRWFPNGMEQIEDCRARWSTVEPWGFPPLRQEKRARTGHGASMPDLARVHA